MSPKTYDRKKSQDTKLAQVYFRSVEETNRLEEMLDEKVAEIVGAIGPEEVDYAPFDDGVILHCSPNHLRVTEDGQRQIYALGFKRIFVYHQNGLETFYYEGGPANGKTGPRDR